jgi:hypothetical protein
MVFMVVNVVLVIMMNIVDIESVVCVLVVVNEERCMLGVLHVAFKFVVLWFVVM